MSIIFHWEVKRVLMHRHFGKKIIAKRTGMTEEDPKVEILWLRLYKVCPSFMEYMS